MKLINFQLQEQTATMTMIIKGRRRTKRRVDGEIDGGDLEKWVGCSRGEGGAEMGVGNDKGGQP